MGQRRQLQNNLHTALCFSVASETLLSTTPARCFLPPLMLLPLPEDVSRSQERKLTCQRGECLHSAASTLSPPALGSQTSGHHQARAAQCRRGDALTVGRPFCFLNSSHSLTQGVVHVDRDALTPNVASPMGVLLVLGVDFRRAENKLCQRRLTAPRSLLTAVYRFHMMSVKASDIQRGLTLTSLIPPRSF